MDPGACAVYSHARTLMNTFLQDNLDDDGHLLCSDGVVSRIERGGRAICSAALVGNHTGFAVYA